MTALFGSHYLRDVLNKIINFLNFVFKKANKKSFQVFRAATDILNSRSNYLCNNSTFTASILIRVCWSNHHYCIACRSAFTAEENLAGGGARRILSRCATPVSGRSMWTRPARPTQCPGGCRICAGCKSSLRPSAMCSVASLVRVTWCFDCSPRGSAGSRYWPRRGGSRIHVPQTGRPQVLGSNCWGLYLMLYW